MPINGLFDPETGVYRTTVTGTVTIKELGRHIATVQQTRAHEHPGLVDARGAHTLTFGTRDLMRFAHHAREMLGATNPAPRAVVVDGLVHFGLARLFASLVAGWMQVGVFECPKAAEAWLTGEGNGAGLTAEEAS